MAQDLRLAVRSLLVHRGFAAGAIVTLALGVGASTAMFSIVHGVLLRPLPYPAADRLVRLSEFHPGATAPFGGAWLSNLTYHAWERAAQTIGPIATYRTHAYTVGIDDPVRLDGAQRRSQL